MTMAEMQEALNKMRYKRTVLTKLVEYMDETFLPDADGKPKMVLLAEDKSRVPETSFDDVANDINSWVKALQNEEQKLLSSQVSIALPQEAA
jgi:hypothetical protein